MRILQDPYRDKGLTWAWHQYRNEQDDFSGDSLDLADHRSLALMWGQKGDAVVTDTIYIRVSPGKLEEGHRQFRGCIVEGSLAV